MNSENATNNMVMPVAPMYGGGYGGNGSLGFGGDWAWILLLLVLGGGWGGFGGFGMGGAMMGAGMMGMDMGFGLYPWMNQVNQMNDGFRDQQLSSQISGIQNAVTTGFGNTQLGIAGVNQNICQTGNTIVSAINSAQNATSQQLYSNEIANLNRSFAEQTANAQGFYNTNTGIADLKYTVATENCADRYEAAQNASNIINAITAGVQSIKDDLCADRLANAQRETEAERRENANLRSQLNMAQFAASQAAQNAFISQGFSNEVDALYDRLKNCPVGTTPVYGNQPIFTCPVNVANGCNGFN